MSLYNKSNIKKWTLNLDVIKFERKGQNWENLLQFIFLNVKKQCFLNNVTNQNKF